jgi:hypothetical protein
MLDVRLVYCISTAGDLRLIEESETGLGGLPMYLSVHISIG